MEVAWHCHRAEKPQDKMTTNMTLISETIFIPAFRQIYKDMYIHMVLSMSDQTSFNKVISLFITWFCFINLIHCGTEPTCTSLIYTPNGWRPLTSCFLVSMLTAPPVFTPVIETNRKEEGKFHRCIGGILQHCLLRTTITHDCAAFYGVYIINSSHGPEIHHQQWYLSDISKFKRQKYNQ